MVTQDARHEERGCDPCGRHTECMQLIFVREGEEGGSDDPVTVRVKPVNWTKTRVGEILDQCAKQVGHDEAGENDALQFSYRGVRLLSCLKMASMSCRIFYAMPGA